MLVSKHAGVLIYNVFFLLYHTEGFQSDVSICHVNSGKKGIGYSLNPQLRKTPSLKCLSTDQSIILSFFLS